LIRGDLFLLLSILKDIPPLVEDLNNAGIRFVHFSEENEIKSQVSFVNCDQNSGQSRWEPQGFSHVCIIEMFKRLQRRFKVPGKRHSPRSYIVEYYDQMI
jgi:hypothetical protein